MRRGNIGWVWVWCLVSIVTASVALAQSEETDTVARDEVATQVDELVLQLASDTIAERDLAETNLLKLAELDAIPLDDFLSLLPAADADLPPAVRERIATIRGTLENRRARAATGGKSITMTAAGWKLSEVLAELAKQSGNQVVDAREDFGQEKADPTVTLIANKLSYWAALDQTLDQARLDVYGYGTEKGELQLIDREPGIGNRFGAATYVGPFRFEAIEVVATRGMRNPTTSALAIELEVAWEPRVQPIVLSLPIQLVTVDVGDAKPLTTTQPGRVFDVEIEPGTKVTQMSLPFELPARAVTSITKLSGTLVGLVPGKQEEFTFADLRGDKAQVQTRGGVEVTLDRVRKNNAVWEVHMRLKLADAYDALASHRGWVFGNSTYLVDKDGNVIDHAGFETTMQSEDAVGIAYLFDLPDGIEGMKWVYKTPAAIVQQEFPFVIEEIELP